MNQRKKFKWYRIVLFVILLISLFYLDVKYNNRYTQNNGFNQQQNLNPKYKTIKLDNSEYYDGIGQRKVTDKDGYFTVFSTGKTNQKIYKEFKQNGTSSWSKKKYWAGTMNDYGCGITVMSIILSGYGKEYTPEDLRKKYYPKLEGNDMSKELSNTFDIENSDFLYASISFTKEAIINHLQSNRPIIICVQNKPTDNRWTTASHYMVLLAVDSKGMVYVSNPNGLENNSKSSGWYNLDEIIPYIAKILYIEAY